MDNIYSKYYTPEKVARALIGLISISDRATVVDICCGSCNLLNAAKQKNNSIICTGVDINESYTKSDFQLFTCDGREFALKNREQYQISLANPPFGKENKNSYTKRLYKGAYEEISVNRIEVEMLIANLMVLDQSGQLLIILPSTIVSGSSNVNLRKIISKNHYIEAVIDLPINAFYPERIKCSALIIKKSFSNKSSSYYKMDDNFNLLKLYEIDAQQIKKGNWEGKANNGNSDFIIHQGKISTSAFTDQKNSIEVLHTSKHTENWTPSVRFAILPQERDYIKAESGDILISRIGASAGDKCLYNGDEKYISDCLLVIKNPSREIQERILSLDLSTVVSGLSTPHITINSICNLYNKIYLKD